MEPSQSQKTSSETGSNSLSPNPLKSRRSRKGRNQRLTKSVLQMGESQSIQNLRVQNQSSKWFIDEKFIMASEAEKRMHRLA